MFWTIVIGTLLGVPGLLLFTGMGMIFAAAGLAGGPQEARAAGIVRGWLAFAWVLASAFGAFGLAPLWRAWHGGAQDFDGSLPVFADWLVGVGIAVLLGAAAVRAMGKGRGDEARPPVWLRLLLLALGLAPLAAIGAWVIWPLVLLAVNGHFEWPDAATGWLRTGKIVAVLLAVSVVEDAVRARRGS